MIGLTAQAFFPPSHRARVRAFAALAALVAFAMPAVGALGLALALGYGLWRPQREQPLWSETLDVPPLLQRAPRAPAKIAFTADALRQILGSRSAPERRFRAILATRALPPREAIPLLKTALADGSDEVRLLGFSRLEGVRREIELRIKARLSALEATPKDASARLHHRVAEDYWELAFLGLVEGEVYRHTLRTASEHAIDALALDPKNAGAALLLARVSLRLGDRDAARSALEAAVVAGMPRRRVAPYEAELALRDGRAGDVAALLAPLGGVRHDHVALTRVIAFWRGSAGE